MTKAASEASAPAPGQQLLTFAEAAKLLGVDRERVYRWAIEDGTLPVVAINTAGVRMDINVQGMLRGAQGGLAFDHDGRLLACYASPSGGERRTHPLGTVLRLDRDSAEGLGRKLATAAATAAGEGDGASLVAPRVQPTHPHVPARLRGLTPNEVAYTFAGIGRTEDEWRKVLGRGGTTWLGAAPVVMKNGRRGRGSNGESRPTLRDPVQIAIRLYADGKATIGSLNQVMNRSELLREWRDEWQRWKAEAIED